MGGVAFHATEEADEVVHVHLVKDRDTGKSKGFGFVFFAAARDAELALLQLDGFDILGRHVQVGLPSGKAAPFCG